MKGDKNNKKGSKSIDEIITDENKDLPEAKPFEFFCIYNLKYALESDPHKNIIAERQHIFKW
jgi:hypothetical protein